MKQRNKGAVFFSYICSNVEPGFGGFSYGLLFKEDKNIVIGMDVTIGQVIQKLMKLRGLSSSSGSDDNHTLLFAFLINSHASTMDGVSILLFENYPGQSQSSSGLGSTIIFCISDKRLSLL